MAEAPWNRGLGQSRSRTLRGGNPAAARRRLCFGVYRRARSVDRATARCSAALRPLRGDFHCARRSAGRRDEGMVVTVEPRDEEQGQAAAGLAARMFRVEGGLGFKHGARARDSEEPIGDAAQGAAMAMTALAQFRE